MATTQTPARARGSSASVRKRADVISGCAEKPSYGSVSRSGKRRTAVVPVPEKNAISSLEGLRIARALRDDDERPRGLGRGLGDRQGRGRAVELSPFDDRGGRNGKNGI